MASIPCFACGSPTTYNGQWLHCATCDHEWEAIIEVSPDTAVKVTDNGRRSPKKEAQIDQGKANQERGQQAEDIARLQLQLLGVARLEKIEVGWRVLWVDGRIVKAFPLEKVSGDFKGMLPGGTAVHVEVKSRSRSRSRVSTERLRYSDVKPHQVEALNEHVELGGLGLLCWVTAAGECLVLSWPIPGFRPRSSLSVDFARQCVWPGVEG